MSKYQSFGPLFNLSGKSLRGNVGSVGEVAEEVADVSPPAHDICADRFCPQCKKPLVIRDDEYLSEFKQRRFCGRACAGKFQDHPKISVGERFWSKVKLNSPEECWEWQGALHPDGYGWFTADHKPEKAHRVAYELSVAKVPYGMWVLHTCDNKKCVNPNHLYAGTVKENARDAVQRGRTACGENSSSAKLSVEQVQQIRELRKQGILQKEVAEQYGVSQSHISGIENGRFWTHPADVCRKRHKGNPNSESAFQSIRDRLAVQQERVLRTIKASDNGLTCDEIAVILGGNPNEVSGRCSELFRDGKIKKIGKRLTRRGNPASVLVAI